MEWDKLTWHDGSDALTCGNFAIAPAKGCEAGRFVLHVLLLPDTLDGPLAWCEVAHLFDSVEDAQEAAQELADSCATATPDAEHCVMDAEQQVIRCEHCGSTAPMAFGSVRYVCETNAAFARAHADCKPGDRKKTWLSTPKVPVTTDENRNDG